MHYNNLNLDVRLSMASMDPGPIPTTVTVPVFTWVLPASLITAVIRPARRALSANVNSSSSFGIWTTILGCPLRNQDSNISWPFLLLKICRQHSRAAWAHCAAVLPFPIGKSDRTTITILHFSPLQAGDKKGLIYLLIHISFCSLSVVQLSLMHRSSSLRMLSHAFSEFLHFILTLPPILMLGYAFLKANQLLIRPTTC